MRVCPSPTRWRTAVERVSTSSMRTLDQPGTAPPTTTVGEPVRSSEADLLGRRAQRQHHHRVDPLAEQVGVENSRCRAAGSPVTV